MNKKQLEKMMGHLRAVGKLIEEDSNGSSEILGYLGKLEAEVANELKNLVWKEYVEAKASQETEVPSPS